jgi:hypothetical protein
MYVKSKTEMSALLALQALLLAYHSAHGGSRSRTLTR